MVLYTSGGLFVLLVFYGFSMGLAWVMIDFIEVFQGSTQFWGEYAKNSESHAKMPKNQCCFLFRCLRNVACAAFQQGGIGGPLWLLPIQLAATSTVSIAAWARAAELSMETLLRGEGAGDVLNGWWVCLRPCFFYFGPYESTLSSTLQQVFSGGFYVFKSFQKAPVGGSRILVICLK